jgi:hypothetical protein
MCWVEDSQLEGCTGFSTEIHNVDATHSEREARVGEGLCREAADAADIKTSCKDTICVKGTVFSGDVGLQ